MRRTVTMTCAATSCHVPPPAAMCRHQLSCGATSCHVPPPAGMCRHQLTCNVPSSNTHLLSTTLSDSHALPFLFQLQPVPVPIPASRSNDPCH